MSESLNQIQLLSRFQQFDLNSPHTLVSFYGTSVRYQSLVAVHIEALANDHILANATGFVISAHGINILVTNWHVLAGRDATTGQPLSKETCAVPNFIRVRFHSRRLLQQGTGKISYQQHLFPLYEGEAPLWKQHPLGQDVDVATLQIGGLGEDTLILQHNTDVETTAGDLTVGNEIYIVGFPNNIATFGHLPIWKRGSIASEVLVDDGRATKFYVDAASRKGMSGAPVYSIRPNEVEIVGSTMTGRMGQVVPVGVYSGRIASSDRLASEIGIVWPIGFVYNVINKGQPGSYRLRRREGVESDVPPLTVSGTINLQDG